ncbi:hypothetical protein EDI_234600 [Entamoeba dispar SAW760]|uniref:FHA domain-containing protein n=1 Tax=Entamoeba dispar (strain ATCC PRA-260 / SAW760) TaxID=370354 RepID=B0E5I2_ENTDS|nr:uncharacterized protein EDI_234600 [Entamoeba dispar SAW760]EDR30216.1 hypothetical protein EDI_234600 [Entamoeba dispar SAW760]|eukprot:EDR30216.1 hypothetical protein EDI_234600 [Entamoeba dispar SAW760]
MNQLDKETLERIQETIGDGMSSVMREYAIWLRMNELNTESDKLKKQIQTNHFTTMLKAELIERYRASNTIRVKLKPLEVSFQEETKEVRLPPIMLQEKQNKSNGIKKKSKRSINGNEVEEKKATRRKKNVKARLICESDEDKIADLDSKSIVNSRYCLGRAKIKNGDDHFIYLNKFTENRSISHIHGYINYNKDAGLFVFMNAGRNGSIVNGKTLFNNDQEVLTNNSIIEMGGFKVRIIYLTY